MVYKFYELTYDEVKIIDPEIEKTQSQEEIKIKEQPLWANITGYHQLK